jgi:hypothetical protein
MITLSSSRYRRRQRELDVTEAYQYRLAPRRARHLWLRELAGCRRRAAILLRIHLPFLRLRTYARD